MVIVGSERLNPMRLAFALLGLAAACREPVRQPASSPPYEATVIEPREASTPAPGGAAASTSAAHEVEAETVPLTLAEPEPEPAGEGSTRTTTPPTVAPDATSPEAETSHPSPSPRDDAPSAAPDQADAAGRDTTCCRVCRKGKACGDACIAHDRSCTVGPGCACNE